MVADKDAVLASLQAMNAELEAAAQMKRDAARYLWLRNHSQERENVGGAIHFSFAVARPEPKQWCIDTKRGADMDAAIDAAIAAKQ